MVVTTRIEILECRLMIMLLLLLATTLLVTMATASQPVIACIPMGEHGGSRETWKDPGNEDWNVDVLFVKLEVTDDQRPGSSNGGGTGF